MAGLIGLVEDVDDTSATIEPVDRPGFELAVTVADNPSINVDASTAEVDLIATSSSAHVINVFLVAG